MRILTPDTFRRYRDRGKATMRREYGPHPYIRSGRTNEYALLARELQLALSSLDRRFSLAVDLGAGDGRLTGLLLDVVDRVIAVDEDEVALRWAERVVGPSNSVKCDLLRFIDSSEQTFEIIMLSHILYYFHCSKWRTVLETAIKKLVPGGVLILCLWCKNCDSASIFREISMRREEQLYAENAVEISTSYGLHVLQQATIRTQHWFPRATLTELFEFFSLGAPDPSRYPTQAFDTFLTSNDYSFGQDDLLATFVK